MNRPLESTLQDSYKGMGVYIERYPSFLYTSGRDNGQLLKGVPCSGVALEHTVFDRMSARGLHLILRARGEALIRKGCSLNTFQKT